MKYKNKKIIALTMSSIMLTAGFTLISAPTLNNDEIGYTDSQNVDIKSNKFDKSFSQKKYYVYKNEKRTILSELEDLEGYECLGLYSSMSSADCIFYVVENNEENILYKQLSYDDLENEYKNYKEIYIIDEESPDSLSIFIPDCSIKNGDYSKSLSKK